MALWAVHCALWAQRPSGSPDRITDIPLTLSGLTAREGLHSSYRLFISDGYVGTRVAKFDKDGKFLFDWGTAPKDPNNPGPNEFNTVHSIAIGKDRRLYVSDRSHSRIQIFDENGKFLDMWPNIRSPYSLLMSADQHLWVSDGVTQKILKYDLNGKFLYGWGTAGNRLGNLDGPHQMSVDQENNLYVADVFGGRVHRFGPRPGADPAKMVGPELRYSPTATN